MSDDTSPHALLRLRNGSQAPRIEVVAVWLNVKHLADSGDLVALYEARELARDPAHVLWPGADATLRAFSLIRSDGTMHDIDRNVILSSVIGAETDLSVQFPVAANDPATTEP